MTTWQRIKCAMGLHGDCDNIGEGHGGALIQGRHIQTVCRVYRCVLCGREFGEVTCPQVHMFGSRSVSADFVRGTSGYREFAKGAK